MEEVYQVGVRIPHHLGHHVHQQGFMFQDRLEGYPAELLEAVAVDIGEVLDLELVDESLVRITQIDFADDGVHLDLIVMLVLLLYCFFDLGLGSGIGLEDVMKDLFLSLVLWLLNVQQCLQNMGVE
jgi:hypothetical protein